MNELSNVKIKKITLQKLAHILSVLKEREKKSLIKNYDSMRQQTRIQLMYIVHNNSSYREKIWVRRKRIAVDVFETLRDLRVRIAVVALQSSFGQEAIGKGEG